MTTTNFVPGRGPAFHALAGATAPLKRTANADDVAAAILACATHLGFATGTTPPARPLSSMGEGR
ncbi:MAG: hypothetical protein ACHQAY_02485 [Hyphomicrobiales bacterium]